MKKFLSAFFAVLMLLALPVFSLAENSGDGADTKVGTRTLGYFDYAACRDHLGNPQSDESYHFASVSSTDSLNLARIVVNYERCGNNSDFSAVTGFIRNEYLSRPYDDDQYNYTILGEEEIEIGGMRAYKISAEKGDLYGFCNGYSYVSYALANSADGFVHIQLVAPKDGWKNEDGTDFHPTIAELCSVIETTYTKA